jgi:hypothetical protein
VTEPDALIAAVKIATAKSGVEYASSWAVIFSAFISTCVLIVIYNQMRIADKQLKTLSTQIHLLHEQNKSIVLPAIADHDRSAKTLAIKLMLLWEAGIKFETKPVVLFVQGLTLDQCKKLDACEPFVADKEKCEYLKIFLPKELPELEERDGKTWVSGQILRHIRHTAVSYLNLMETILTAWHEGIADRKIIEDQFAPLFVAGDDGMKNLRDANRKYGEPSDLPCIESFIEIIEARGRQGSIAKTPTQWAGISDGPFPTSERSSFSVKLTA